MSDFRGRTGLVTGAGSGIGRAALLEFARRGASVAAIDIDIEAARDAASEASECCPALGNQVIPLYADVSDAEACQSAVDTLMREFERLDFALNNAAIMGDRTPLHEMSLERWHHMVAANLDSVFYSMRAELRYMLPAKQGVIVNVASNAGLFGIAGMPAYVATKHGVVGLSKAAAVDYGPVGIRVVALCPGSTETPMMARELSDDPTAVAQRAAATPLGRLAHPEEIAKVAVFLASDDASYVTGEWIRVDGGRRA